MSAAVDPLLVAVRFAVFVLSLALFGSACFEVYAPTDIRGRTEIGYRLLGPGLLVLAALAYVALLAREIAPAPGWPPLGIVATIWLTTGFGRALAATAILAATLAVVGGLAPRSRWLVLGLSGASLASLAFVGHAAGGEGPIGEARVVVQAVHLLAAGAWLGGLPRLARTLGDDDPSAVHLLARFGVMGAVAVTLVLATGVATTAFVVTMSGGALGPDYLRVLSLKLGLVLALFSVAAVNRFRLTPMMRRNPLQAVAALRRTILLEQLLGLGAVASVALLGQLDPKM